MQAITSLLLYLLLLLGLSISISLLKSPPFKAIPPISFFIALEVMFFLDREYTFSFPQIFFTLLNARLISPTKIKGFVEAKFLKGFCVISLRNPLRTPIISFELLLLSDI